MHDYHDELPNFHPDQILHDGCEECEERSNLPNRGISSLDSKNFERAWKRAADWNKHGCLTISQAEIPLLSVLVAVQLQFERRGIPMGELPVKR